MSVDRPFALSHQLAFRVEGGREACYVIANYLRDFIENDDITIKEKDLKGSVEISPPKRTAYQSFYSALDHVKEKMEVKDFDYCLKSMHIYKLPSYDLIGKVPKEGVRFEWNAEVCTSLPLTTHA